MDINQAYSFIQFCYNKVQSGNISPTQFNNLAPIAQLSVINQLLGNEMDSQGQLNPKVGFGLNQKTLELLRPLIVVPTNLSITAGLANYPADCLYVSAIQIPGAYQPAEPVQFDEAIYLTQSQIKPPTAKYPKHYTVSSYIYVLPNTITTTGLISYVRRPLTPFWNSFILNQAPVYNPSGSQDFEVSTLLHLKICQRILEYVGINLDLPAITQLSMAMEAQGQ